MQNKDQPGGRARKLYLDPNLHIVFSITLMAVMGVATVSPAFPKIIEEFNITPIQVGWLITAFTFPGVFLTLAMGVMADRYGRKKILIPSLLLFAVAGTACSQVRDFHLLMMLRFLQGIGAASLGSLNSTLIGDLFHGPERPAAMGYNASVLSIGTGFYPFIGGLLAMLGWHYPFYLPLLAIPVALFVLLRLNNPEPRNHQGLKEYCTAVFRSVYNKNAIGLFIATVTTFIILYGSGLTYFPILASQKFGASPVAIGLLMSAMSLASGTVATQLGPLTAKFSSKKLIVAGFALYGVSMLILPLVNNVWLLVVPNMIFGAGNAINITSIQTLLTGLAPLETRGAFMSFNGMLLRLGQTIGPLIMGACYAIYGINAPFFAGAVFALSIIIVVPRMVKNH